MHEQLWTPEDNKALATLMRAVDQGDLLAGLVAIEDLGIDEELRIRAIIDSWGRKVADALVGGDATSEVNALTSVISEELGFHGSGDAYNDPRNSFISHVVKRRSGLPILLACVWQMIGENCGLAVDGIGLPFHFIARVGGEGGILVDPFKGGKPLTVEDCSDMIDTFSEGQVDWDPAFLDVVPAGSIFERILRNLMNAFSSEGDIVGLYRSVRMIVALCPDEAHYQLAYGRMAEFLGQTNIATQVYTGLIQGFEGSAEADSASERLVAMSSGGLSN